MRLRRVTLTIESRLEEVPLLGTLVNAICGTAELTAEECNQVELCVVEAVNNCIKHAYLLAPGHSVEVQARLSSDFVVFDIVDSGRPADPRLMTFDHRHKLKMSATNSSQLPESGRGLAIMQQLMDSCEYSSRATKNRLRLTKRLRVKAPGNIMRHNPEAPE